MMSQTKFDKLKETVRSLIQQDINESGAPDWWARMSAKQQDDYIKTHPNSKQAKDDRDIEDKKKKFNADQKKKKAAGVPKSLTTIEKEKKAKEMERKAKEQAQKDMEDEFDFDFDESIEEASVTGAIDGGEGPPKTPFAFRGKRKKDKKKKESIANQSGYSITEAAKFAVFFKLGKDGQFGTASILIDAGSKGEAKMKVAKMLKGGQKAISSVRRINVGKAKQIDKKLESVNESSYHKRQITDFIKKNKDMATGFTPTIQLKGANSKTNHLNISFGALEQLAKIMMKESINEADESALKAKMAKQMDTVKKHRESMKKHSGKDVKKANAARDRMKAAQAKVDDTQDKIIGIKKESVNEALKSKSNVIKLAGAVMSHMEDLVDYTGKDYDKAVNTFGTMIKNSLEQISRMNVKPHPQYDYSDKRSVHPMIKDEKSHLKFLNDYKKLTKKMIPLIKTLINKPSKPGIVKVMKYYNSSKYQEMNSVIATGDFGNNHVIESITEGRYHDYRNDDTMTPKQKIGRSMMEVRDTLRNLENIVGMNIRLKNEIGVDSTSYWKRTHGAMNKISERLVKLANKVGQLH
jgi:hypothetical protein